MLNGTIIIEYRYTLNSTNLSEFNYLKCQNKPIFDKFIPGHAKFKICLNKKFKFVLTFLFLILLLPHSFFSDIT